MPEPFKVDYPRIIAVRAPLIPEGATDEEREETEDQEAVAALSIFVSGHGGHGGWSYDPATEGIACQCGALVYPLPVASGTGVTA